MINGSQGWNARCADAGVILPLIGLAHGSRDPRAGVAIAELMAEVASRRPGLVAAPAFLDLTAPTLAEAAQNLLAANPTLTDSGAIVVPLLFTEAFHARVDVPDAIAEAVVCAGVPLTAAPILGTGRSVLMALQASTERAGIARGTTMVLLAVGSSDARANAAVASLAREWANERSAAVEVAFVTCEPRFEAVMDRLRAGGGTAAPVAIGGGSIGDGSARDLAVGDGSARDLAVGDGSARDLAIAAGLVGADSARDLSAGDVSIGDVPMGEVSIGTGTAAQGSIGIVPLFLAPGVLLDRSRDLVLGPAASWDFDAGVTVADPLGTALADLVLERYDEALRSRGQSSA